MFKCDFFKSEASLEQIYYHYQIRIQIHHKSGRDPTKYTVFWKLSLIGYPVLYFSIIFFNSRKAVATVSTTNKTSNVKNTSPD
jgi:hypothetical protein